MEAVATSVFWHLLPQLPAVPVPQGSTCRQMGRPAHLVWKNTFAFQKHLAEG